MSQLGQKRRFCRVRRMSAFPPIATGSDFGPCPLARLTTPLPHSGLIGTEKLLYCSLPSPDFVQLGS